jgi:ferredoxin
MASRSSHKTARSRARWVRWTILGAVLVAMTTIVTAHATASGPGRWAPVDFLCPFGGLETLYSLLLGEGFLRHTAASSVILLIGMLVMALIYRRSFCGTLCPLGALQGLFGALGRKVLGRRVLMPRYLDGMARYLKYAILAWFAIWTWQAAELVLRPYDPWVAWAHLTSGELLTTYLVGFVILVISLAGSFVYDRFFCKYLCPVGALLGLLSKASILSIRRDASACIGCDRCDSACMMNVPVATADVVTSAECISCNECVNACPVAGALTVVAPARKRMSALASTAMVTALLVAIVGATTVAGQFQWRQPSLAGAMPQQGSAGAGPDTSLIRGSTTLREVADATGIASEEFTNEFGVPGDQLDRPISEIKDAYGFTPEDVRAWVESRSP